MLTNLLLYRFALFNGAMLVLVGWTWERGLLSTVVEGDRTRIVFAILALFGAAWLGTARQVLRASLRLNRQKRHGVSDGHRAKDHAKAQWLEDASDWMVGLGLVGTVIGFAVALGGVGEANSAAAARETVEHLMRGMQIAVYTTITGAICALWNAINQRMLRTAVISYWEDAR